MHGSNIKLACLVKKEASYPDTSLLQHIYPKETMPTAQHQLICFPRDVSPSSQGRRLSTASQLCCPTGEGQTRLPERHILKSNLITVRGGMDWLTGIAKTLNGNQKNAETFKISWIMTEAHLELHQDKYLLHHSLKQLGMPRSSTRRCID